MKERIVNLLDYKDEHEAQAAIDVIFEEERKNGFEFAMSSIGCGLPVHMMRLTFLPKESFK